MTVTKTMTLRAYGRHRKTSVESVRRAIAAERLKACLVVDNRGRTRIDPAVADTEWERNKTAAQLFARTRVTAATAEISRADDVPAEHLSVFTMDGHIVFAYAPHDDGTDAFLIPMTEETAVRLAMKLVECATQHQTKGKGK